MTKFTSADAEKLLKLAETKKSLVAQYYDLTCKQQALIAEEDTDLLNLNLTMRQQIIVQMESVHNDYIPLFEAYNSNKASLPEGNLHELLLQINKDISDMLARCQDMDNENTEQIKFSMEELLSKAQDISSSRKTIGAYKQATGSTSGFFDKKQ